eukprot:762577-Rhodomonas_salina.2
MMTDYRREAQPPLAARHPGGSAETLANGNHRVRHVSTELDDENWREVRDLQLTDPSLPCPATGTRALDGFGGKVPVTGGLQSVPFLYSNRELKSHICHQRRGAAATTSPAHASPKSDLHRPSQPGISRAVQELVQESLQELMRIMLDPFVKRGSQQSVELL